LFSLSPYLARHKLTTDGYMQGKEGVVIVKTKQALLITHYPETVQPGVAASTVEKLGDYLTGVGY
jgi:profilin